MSKFFENYRLKCSAFIWKVNPLKKRNLIIQIAFEMFYKFVPSFRKRRNFHEMRKPGKAEKLKLSFYKRDIQVLIFIFLSAYFFVGCALGVSTPGAFQQIYSRSLSFNEPELRTCIFDPYYSVVHFPMYHDPPTTNYSSETYELVAKSQFQLLHTIIDYHRSGKPLAVFDEHITSDSYNANYIQTIERGAAKTDTYSKFNGSVYRFEERYKTAQYLFGRGFPSHYEYLTVPQKKFLFDTGASLTLYLLKEIPQIHKVISSEKLKLAKSNLIESSVDFLNSNENYYWIFTFRELELKREVDRFYQRNPLYNGLVFIAYGAKHDLSDDFIGVSFQSGSDFCLKWDHSSVGLP